MQTESCIYLKSMVGDGLLQMILEIHINVQRNKGTKSKYYKSDRHKYHAYYIMSSQDGWL